MQLARNTVPIWIMQQDTAIEFFRQEAITKLLPIIAMSHSTFPEVREKALSQGADRFLHKNPENQAFQQSLVRAIEELTR